MEGRNGEMSMFTNYDAQQVLNDNDKLSAYLINSQKIGPGSGEEIIHKYALVQILQELKACRREIKELRQKR